MFYAKFDAFIKDTFITFKDNDKFPGITVKAQFFLGKECTIYSSDPLMMLFIINSVTADSLWRIKGDLQQRAYIDEDSYYDRVKVNSFCIPSYFQEQPHRKEDQAYKTKYKSIALDDNLLGSMDDLKKIIIGFIVFQKYSSIKSVKNVDLDERIAYFEKILNVNYTTIEEVETDFYQYFPEKSDSSQPVVQ